MFLYDALPLIYIQIRPERILFACINFKKLLIILVQPSDHIRQPVKLPDTGFLWI